MADRAVRLERERQQARPSVWQKQPLVLINATGNATSDDIIELEEEIVRSVHKKFGVTIEPEVEKIRNI